MIDILAWHRAFAASGLVVTVFEVAQGGYAETLVIGVAGNVYASVIIDHGGGLRAIVTSATAHRHVKTPTIDNVLAALREAAT